ncbi:superoxide dismutase [Candidatus Pacearchaeota archaeon]|nr:superoxide dismutase [Candidatus Pacearchaeota archaeon]
MYKIEELGFELPELPFAYNALEPYMDEETMKIHHSKHHKAYADKLKGVAEKNGFSSQKPLDLIKNINSLPKEAQKGVRNFGGGHINHSFFWTVLKKGISHDNLEVIRAIEKKFESYEKFVEQFTNASNTFFGSGWTWLVVNANKELEIINTANQDSPYSNNQKPILCLDLWEHAYYILYKWNRAEYVKNWWNIVNWEKVNEYYLEAMRE